tara:strand:+ start:3001 stop:3864 length:864 start_codon:yes stop_codon:yes gene_type:complete
MGGDNFKKSSSENPHVSSGNTILSRLNNEWELAKIRHDAAAEYFDELCEMVEFEINTHHNNRNYFMFIEIEFPENLNQFVPRPRRKDIDFLMQNTWSDKFQEFMRKQEINCHLIKSNNRNNNILKIDYTAKETIEPQHWRGGKTFTFTYDFDSLKFNRTKLNSDYLMSEFNHRRREFTGIAMGGGRSAIKLERTLESVNGNYINSNSRSAIGLSFCYRHDDLELSAMLNCYLSIERLPDGYFLGLTDREIEYLKTTRQRYLLTWPKHVYVEEKSWTNDFKINGERLN